MFKIATIEYNASQLTTCCVLLLFAIALVWFVLVGCLMIKSEVEAGRQGREAAEC